MQPIRPSSGRTKVQLIEKRRHIYTRMEKARDEFCDIPPTPWRREVMKVLCNTQYYNWGWDDTLQPDAYTYPNAGCAKLGRPLGLTRLHFMRLRTTCKIVCPSASLISYISEHVFIKFGTGRREICLSWEFIFIRNGPVLLTLHSKLILYPINFLSTCKRPIVHKLLHVIA